jgi:hypothetical protein
MDPSLEREKELLRGGPERVERPRDVFTPAVLSVRLVRGRLSRSRLCGGGSHLIERHTSKRSLPGESHFYLWDKN